MVERNGINKMSYVINRQMRMTNPMRRDGWSTNSVGGLTSGTITLVDRSRSTIGWLTRFLSHFRFHSRKITKLSCILSWNETKRPKNFKKERKFEKYITLNVRRFEESLEFVKGEK